MHTLMKGTTGDTPPPTFPSLTFNNTMASDAVGTIHNSISREISLAP